MLNVMQVTVLQPILTTPISQFFNPYKMHYLMNVRNKKTWKCVYLKVWKLALPIVYLS